MLTKMRLFERRFVANFNAPPAPPPGDEGKGGTGGGDSAAEIAALKAEIAALKAPKPPTPGDEDLADKARKTRDASDKESARTRQLESALKFGMKAPEFLKQNEAILPKDVADIFSQADKETYSDAIEKDAAIKSGLIQSFFAVQANVDLLTPGQKSTLDEYLKLTKTEKQNRAQQLHDMVFEPAFEMLKRIKKAEALSKGFGGGTDAEAAYKQKLQAGSRKHYLGEK